jgi:hypothetical protein
MEKNLIESKCEYMTKKTLRGNFTAAKGNCPDHVYLDLMVIGTVIDWRLDLLRGGQRP